MKFEIETKRTLITDNGNRFTEGSEIAFTYKNSGDSYIAELRYYRLIYIVGGNYYEINCQDQI